MKKITLLAVMLFLACTSALRAITISGGPNICIGINKTLTIDTSGGTWSISNPAAATIGATTGIITGLTIGSATVTYAVGTAVFTTPVLVYPQPGAITGTSSTCAGSNSTLTVSGAGSGNWTSSNSSVASIGTGSGTLTGVSPGTATITYTRTISGCFVTRTQTVLTTPSAISGSSAMCVGTTQTLTSTPAGGTWTRSNGTVASIGASSGIFNALAAGSTNVVYTLTGGCNTSRSFSVINLPAAITGTTNTCVGNTTTLASASSGGTWTSATTSVATIGSTTGVVTGSAPGTSVITYTMGTGCTRTTTVNISAAIGAIAGTSVICTGQSATLTNATSGGTWSSSNTAIATVGMYSGIVSGMAAGTATISYRLSGCLASAVITITATPGAITGNANVCKDASTPFIHTITGGSWSSSNTSVATVSSSSGIVTGVNTGVATISYFVSPGCYVTKTIGVNPLPNNIYGDSTTCPGSYLSFTNTTPDGTWSSSNTTVATIGSASGIANGLTAGTSIISYTKTTTGCFKTKLITINAGTVTISGSLTFCTGNTSALSASLSGGSWSSSNPTIATINPTSGLATAVSTGTSTISYTLPGGTLTTAIVTINATPTIVGSSTLCISSVVSLTATPSGGTWSSSDASVATVGTSGKVTGISAATAYITYTSENGCFSTTNVTVGSTTAPNIGCVKDGEPPVFYFRNTYGFSGVSVTYTATIQKVVAGVTVNTIPDVSATPLAISATALSETAIPIADINGLAYDSSFPTNWKIIGFKKKFVHYSGCTWVQECTMSRPNDISPTISSLSESVITIRSNPTTGQLSMEASVSGELSILTIDGRIVASESLVKGTNHITLPAQLARGMYVVRFKGNDGSAHVARIVLE
ncbi:MAG: Ig-like domain-containing protein [Chitinophagaceae bacterium]|nr:Ig-like domain-containing protein [Chitinophagaceae bacterium]